MNPHDDYHQNGYVLIRSGSPADLLKRLQDDFAPLLAARDAGGTSLDWRHQTILEPRHFRRSFVEFLDLPALNRTAEQIIGTPEISFSGLAVLLGRAAHSICKWHRDFGDTDPEIDALLADPTMMIQFNCAVFDDPALWVVPGSHRRPSKAEETAFADQFQSLDFTGPFEPAKKIASDPLGGMPGSMHVPLRAGDCLLYNPIIWHAAEYRPEWRRATLHGGWRDAAKVDRFRALRWGLDHNPWLMKPNYLGDLGSNFGPQLSRFQAQVRQHHPSLAN
jgi:hypothetical protein